jgi:transposase
MGKECLVRVVPAKPENGLGGSDDMLKPDEVSAMKGLWQKGWRIKQIARELGHGKNTVRRFVRAFEEGRDEGPAPAGPLGRPRGLSHVPREWLKARLQRHAGNADVLRQEIISEFGAAPSLRTVERAVAPFRQELRAETLATIRFETPPGKQIQVDFGTKTVLIAGVRTKVYLCVLTLGYSRRIFVRASRSETQADWFTAIEGALQRFGGVPGEILVDNAKALVEHNDGAGNVRFNAGFKAFCDYWGLKARACRPYRARTKGKDERAVQYVKRNAIAGREFGSWSEMEAHLDWWMREIADCRVHQTTKEVPMARFAKEQAALLPLGSQKPYLGACSWRRVVKTDATIDVQGNSYSVPYKLIGKTVEATLVNDQLRITLAGEVISRHEVAKAGSGARCILADHLKGVMRLWGAAAGDAGASASTPATAIGDSALLRPLSEYEDLFSIVPAMAAVGGAL